MALYLSDAEHYILDRFLSAVLEAYKSGKMNIAEARADLAHAMTAAAIDEQSGFLNHIRLVAEDLEMHSARGASHSEESLSHPLPPPHPLPPRWGRRPARSAFVTAQRVAAPAERSCDPSQSPA